jgi:hypothetical protein
MTEHEDSRFDPPIVEDSLELVRAEYLEMPGLKLTKPQVQRMWSLDPDTCDRVLDELETAHFLELTPHGDYVLARH